MAEERRESLPSANARSYSAFFRRPVNLAATAAARLAGSSTSSATNERRVSAVKIGQEVTVSCDGCAPVKANISFVSPQAEYTSPLIYSKENRASLMFLVEARARQEDAVRLHPGQPVEIHP